MKTNKNKKILTIEEKKIQAVHLIGDIRNTLLFAHQGTYLLQMSCVEYACESALVFLKDYILLKKIKKVVLISIARHTNMIRNASISDYNSWSVGLAFLAKVTNIEVVEKTPYNFILPVVKKTLVVICTNKYFLEESANYIYISLNFIINNVR